MKTLVERYTIRLEELERGESELYEGETEIVREIVVEGNNAVQ